MVDRTSLANVKECIDRGKRFVLTTHVNPDGDGLGSEAALAAFLMDLGKEVFIFNSNSVPPNYHFLDPNGRMINYDTNIHLEILQTADYVVILDISDWARLKRFGVDLKELDVKKICIDHHPPKGEFGDVRLINSKASATGEIIYDLIKFCGGKITREIAEGIYTTILTDTGSFKYSNTTAHSFKIAGELVETGISPEKIYQQVYEHQSLSKVKLFGYVINNLRFEKNGRVAWFTIPQKVMNGMGAKSHETEGFADYPRVIEGVEISVMFTELEPKRVKVSLRSKGNYVINGVAQKFGGGGHPFAAGVLLEGSLKEYIPKILEEVSYLIKG